MSLEWEQTLIDCRDPVALGRWWAEALGWVTVDDGPEEVEIRPAPDRLPGLLFAVSSDSDGRGRGRIHLDFRPDDHAAEVARFLGLGATKADVGQTGDEPWEVLADPEGNVFCILGERRAPA